MRNAESGARNGLAAENSALPLARIELAPAEIPTLLGNGKLATVAEELKKIGYAHVTLDLLGYRRGSTNEALGGSPK